MRRIFIAMVAVMVCVGTAAAKNWCESLINVLNSSEGVDKSVSVNRDVTTHEITHATYDFRFTSAKLYDTVKKTLMNHASDVEFYSETGNKNKVITLRMTDNGRRWSCKLQKLGKNGKQFLVRVSSGDKNQIVISGGSKNKKSLTMEEKRKVKSEVQKALEQARRDMERARNDLQRYREDARDSRIITTPPTQDKKAAINSIDEELKRAEQERARKLNR